MAKVTGKGEGARDGKSHGERRERRRREQGVTESGGKAERRRKEEGVTKPKGKLRGGGGSKVWRKAEGWRRGAGRRKVWRKAEVRGRRGGESKGSRKVERMGQHVREVTRKVGEEKMVIASHGEEAGGGSPQTCPPPRLGPGWTAP
eukprot:354058-Chlamydomonas_euryale.AAC.1